MSALWDRWVALCAAEEDARPLALVRIGVGLAVLLDLLRTAWLGLVPVIFVPFSAGGLSRTQDVAYSLGGLLPPTLAGPVAFWIAVVCFAAVVLGVWMRPAILVGAYCYAQLGHLYSPGDRAIDRILRAALLILLFSGAEARWSLSRKPLRERLPVWPKDLLKTLLVVVYLSAGTSKLMQQPHWLSLDGLPVLYRIMTDPLAAHVSPMGARSWLWLLRILGFGTIAMECSAWLLYTRLAPVWALAGVGMHLGVALTMDLGMFSWGMLALYPVLFAPWIVARLDRRAQGGRT